MSNKAVIRDRRAKNLQRQLEYVSLKPRLWTMADEFKRRLNGGARLTREERVTFRRWLFWKYGGAACGYCGRVMPLEALTIDHIQPVSKGGAMRDVCNMVLACLGCNRVKGNKWLY